MAKQISIETLYEISTLSEPLKVGDKIYYIETEINKDDNSYERQLKAYNPETQLTSPWSPKTKSLSKLKVDDKQKYLYYLANHSSNEKPQVFRISLTGGVAEEMTKAEEGVSEYYITSSANLYYQTRVKQDEDDDKDKKEKQPKPLHVKDLNYKMDGSGINALDHKFQFLKVNSDTGESETLIEEDKPFRINYVSDDEDFVVYSVHYHQEDEWRYGSQLYLINLKSKNRNRIQLENPEGSLHFVAANSSESKFLLGGNDFKYRFTNLNHLYLYDVESGKLEWITEDLDEYVGDMVVADIQQGEVGFKPFWSDDETYYFATTHHGRIKVYQGQGTDYQLVFDKNYHITGNSPSIQDGELIVTYSSLTEASKLGKINLETGKLEELHNPNSTLDEYEVVKPQGFWFTNSADMDIQGWFLTPNSVQGKVPTILYIHGGPQVCYGESFFHEMQALAGAGYGVLMLNPRGGNGYGQEFVSAILGDYGNVDYQDLMEGLDHAIEAFQVIDEENLFVTGGSYGGFMTNWIVGRNHRFKAGVTQRSISNWLSFYGTSDIGPFFVPFQLEHDMSNVQRLWEMSPLKYADQFQTPLLILHGMEDLRCPQEQAEQMYIALKKQGVDTEMILFPKSSHGLSRKGLPNLRIQRLEAIQNWFEKYRN